MLIEITAAKFHITIVNVRTDLTFQKRNYLSLVSQINHDWHFSKCKLQLTNNNNSITIKMQAMQIVM